ncbi:DUF4003 family protein [Clostridium sp. BJN0001]|uniref:DUF4003 family protein n=1 Tax=Clostridium sp. BJN0001 TaxID=2930219 RepID=UPI001FD180C7|nr:DUF4003 family protein [Clostridium sp. BJN0001]
MNNNIREVCDFTIRNFRKASETLRFDGELINHFASMLNGYKRRYIDGERIRVIRNTIEEKTSKTSQFRGDTLYILSFLIESNQGFMQEKILNDIVCVYDIMIDKNMPISEQLVLSAYTICRYADKKDYKKYIEIAEEMYTLLNENYLLCVMFALNNNTKDEISNVLELYSNSSFSKSMLASMILNNKNVEKKIRICEILNKELDESKLKIPAQFLPVADLELLDENVDRCIHFVKQVTEYMCIEESAYIMYMDTEIRNMIALTSVLMSDRRKIINMKFVDEFLAYGVYATSVNKNQSVFDEILA